MPLTKAEAAEIKSLVDKRIGDELNLKKITEDNNSSKKELEILLERLQQIK